MHYEKDMFKETFLEFKWPRMRRFVVREDLWCYCLCDIRKIIRLYTKGTTPFFKNNYTLSQIT